MLYNNLEVGYTANLNSLVLQVILNCLILKGQFGSPGLGEVGLKIWWRVSSLVKLYRYQTKKKNEDEEQKVMMF